MADTEKLSPREQAILARNKRLSDALRENLKRRKQWQKGMQEAQTPHDEEEK